MTDTLKLAVVGHTNVGKTSLLRTLTRDRHFGEVSHRPGTTRHVEGARLSAGGEAVLDLFDTPGMEDAIALRDHYDSLAEPGERLDGPQRIRRLLATPACAQRFEQEAKVLRSLIEANAGLYVIDAREPVLAKYRDELALLGDCGKPLLPVLNFVADPQHRGEEWREMLARQGLHAVVRFDSVAPPGDGERRLYESLALLLEPARPRLEKLIAEHATRRRERLHSAGVLIADLLIDAAACRRPVQGHPEAIATAIEQLHTDLRQREQRCVEELLQLFAFSEEDAEASELPLLDGRWGDDLFHPETLRQLGVQLGSGMAAGAAAGAGIDLLVGGLSLGAAAAIGAIAGGSWQTLSSYGQRLRDRITGHRELTVDDAILRLLALRQQQLLTALDQRGHAARQRLQLSSPEQQQWREGKLPEPVDRARAHPEWSRLNGRLETDSERQKVVQALGRQLLEA